MAPTGAVVNQAGACATLASPTMRASGCELAPLGLARAHQHQRRRAVRDRAASWPAVTVPSLRKAGLSFGIFAGSAVNGCSSRATSIVPVRALTATGAISLANEPSSLAALRALQALDGEGVLRLARELVVLRGVLGEGAHQAALVVGVLQAVEEHVVLDLGVAEPGAGAHLGQQVGRVGHALHAAGDDDVARRARAGRRRPASPSSCPSRTSC